MRNRLDLVILFFSISCSMVFAGCHDIEDRTPHQLPGDSVTTTIPDGDTALGKNHKKPVPVFTGNEIKSEAIHPDSIVAFARTLMGIPYLYASTDPSKGFDCSGLITYVFNHFNIAVPRSSVDFTNMGREISLDNAKPGDLILFTGTDSTIRIVGHMGIVESINDDTVNFIHSTSGKAKGVVITPFENYYRSRFVKVIRVFPEEFFE
ncbi:MAG: C40 family peptidase [Ferruginibacter sp.]|nr:C40 family peptidase [Chitinophagaceae bacterium]